MRVFLLERIFMFPGELRAPPRVPVNLNQWYPASLQSFDLPFHDFNGSSTNCSATFPTLGNTLKSPTYLGFSLPRLPNRTTPFQGLSLPSFLGLTPGQSVGILQPLPSLPVIDIFDHKVPHKRDEFKKFAANFVELVKLHKLKVSGLQAEISKQQKMHSDSEKRCSLIEQNHIALQVKSQNQLQEKDNVIKDLQKQISEMQVSRERSTEGRVKTQALEIALSQLKAQLASAHIQLNSYKEENKTLSQRYEELAKSNMASHVHICFMA
nr:hypothetical protein [Tanacetum cinerariifolium]